MKVLLSQSFQNLELTLTWWMVQQLHRCCWFRGQPSAYPETKPCPWFSIIEQCYENNETMKAAWIVKSS